MVRGVGMIDDVGDMTLGETFPSLLAQVATVDAAYDATSGALTGQLTAGETAVAIFDETGHLVATGDCL